MRGFAYPKRIALRFNSMTPNGNVPCYKKMVFVRLIRRAKRSSMQRMISKRQSLNAVNKSN